MSQRHSILGRSDSNLDPILVGWEIPSDNWVFRGINAHWSAVPIASESMVITRISADGAEYDTQLRAFDPTIDGVQNWACADVPFWFNRGDFVRIEYANTDSNVVAFTAWLQEVI